mgnify:CR=1 FL=1
MENRYFLQAYEAEGRGRAIPRDVLYVGTPEKCRELMERLESEEMTQGDVRELFTKEQETLQEPEQPQEQKRYPAFYGHTLSYAMEHGEVDKYSDSRKIDRECKEAVEEKDQVLAEMKKSLTGGKETELAFQMPDQRFCRLVFSGM